MANDSTDSLWAASLSRGVAIFAGDRVMLLSDDRDGALQVSVGASAGGRVRRYLDAARRLRCLPQEALWWTLHSALWVGPGALMDALTPLGACCCWALRISPWALACLLTLSQRPPRRLRFHGLEHRLLPQLRCGASAALAAACASLFISCAAAPGPGWLEPLIAAVCLAVAVRWGPVLAPFERAAGWAHPPEVPTEDVTTLVQSFCARGARP